MGNAPRGRERDVLVPEGFGEKSRVRCYQLFPLLLTILLFVVSTDITVYAEPELTNKRGERPAHQCLFSISDLGLFEKQRFGYAYCKDKGAL